MKDDGDIKETLAMLDQAAPQSRERRNSLDSKTGDVLEREERGLRFREMSKKDKKGRRKGSKSEDKDDNDAFFIIKDGKLVKSPSGGKKQKVVAAAKPAFSIVNGKLVKNDLSGPATTKRKKTKEGSAKVKKSASGKKKKPKS